MSYRDAGVDIDRGNRLVERIKPLAASTADANVLAGLGGFGALYSLPVNRFREPVLVSGTDGVGTKLMLAIAMSKHDTIGIDLVAMCANDIVVQGAEPLFFLDYFATGHLDEHVAEQVVRGIAEGCRQAGAALIGGETAEMPGMYADGHYDLAGFCVGAVEKSEILDARRVESGDKVIGLASSGPHSNGYSLIRRIIDRAASDLSLPLGDTTLGEALLAPTRIYVKSILQLLKIHRIHAVAHITGGGLTENLPRMLPQHTEARLDSSAWQRPVVFDWIEAEGEVAMSEMRRTFNCGVGMTVCVPPSEADAVVSSLQELGETAWLIGEVATSKNKTPEAHIL